jgi:hypothetical protein
MLKINEVLRMWIINQGMLCLMRGDQRAASFVEVSPSTVTQLKL